MIKNWIQFNEKQLDLFRPILKNKGLYPLFSEDIEDNYLLKFVDNNYIIEVIFGFWDDRVYLNNTEGRFSQLINKRDVRPCINVRLFNEETDDTDLTDSFKTFIKRMEKFSSKIVIEDEVGEIGINSIEIKGGIFVEGEAEIGEIDYPLSINLIGFDDIHFTDKMIYDFYSIPVTIYTSFNKKGEAFISVPRDILSDCVISKKSYYKEIIDDPDYDMDEFYRNDYLQDHESFFEYDLDENSINALLDCCFKNFDKIKTEYDESFLNDINSLDDLKKSKKKYYSKIGKFLSENEICDDLYDELRRTYSDWSNQSQVAEDYKTIISEFDEVVEEELKTTIVEKLDIDEKKRYKTKDSEGNDIWKETTYQRPYYKIKFNFEWLDGLDSAELFELGDVEDRLQNWAYNCVEKTDLNPRLSDYGDVDKVEFNKEVISIIKDRL